MTTQTNATAIPAVEVVLSDVVANLALLVHAYLNPSGGGPEAAAAPDLVVLGGEASDAADVAEEREVVLQRPQPLPEPATSTQAGAEV